MLPTNINYIFVIRIEFAVDWYYFQVFKTFL